jgi:hypothetical protein
MASFSSQGDCSHWGHYFGANFGADGEDAMRVFAYVGISFLIYFLAPAPMAIAVAETASQVVAPETQSPPQPSPGVEEDLLNLQD